MLTLYVYQKCSTCRDAIKWLDQHQIAYEMKAIRETPPSADEIKAALDAHDGNLRKIFNTSGMDYRALDLKNQLPNMSEIDAINLLSKNGNLIKRPFLIGHGKSWIGFKKPEWENSLLSVNLKQSFR